MIVLKKNSYMPSGTLILFIYYFKKEFEMLDLKPNLKVIKKNEI